MKPIIVYPGSKHDFYPEIRERLPRDIRVFCEPFIGGGSTTLNLLADMEFNIERAVIGDISPRIATFWQQVISDPVSLSKRYDELFKPFDNVMAHLGTRRTAFLDIEWFGKLPDGDPLCESERYAKIAAVRSEIYDLHSKLVALSGDELTTAAQVALVHTISYSGVGFVGGASYQRVAKTHMGGKLEGFKQASRLLRAAKTEVVCGDFEETCSRVMAEEVAFVYLDPPYVFQADKLYEHGLSDGTFSHTRLAEYLFTLPKNISFLLSYDDSAFTRRLYSGFPGAHVDDYKLPRGYCAGSAGKETALNGEELFISNYTL